MLGLLLVSALGDLDASASPASVSGQSLTPGVIVTDSTTCTGFPPGGTFSWEFVSGDASIVATTAGQASTTFQADVQSPGTIQAIWRCRYTLGGDDVFSNNVTAELTLF